MNKILGNIFLIAVIFFGTFLSIFIETNSVSAENNNLVNVYVFEREDCNFCKLEKDFLNKLLTERKDFNIIYLDINDIKNKQNFNKLTEQQKITKATPITLVGNSIIQGFSSADITGKRIISIIDKYSGKESITLDKYLKAGGDFFSQENSTCEGEDNTSCSVPIGPETEVKIPFFGIINYKDFSLFSISVILGFIDGFNPCAMWVLLAFLLVLWQIGNKKKMLQVAGLFILAEGVMYWLILNFWFSAWDFVGLDQIVTPVVGIVSIGGGIYFLSRYFKNRKQLVCDITSVEYKTKTEEKIKDVIKRPMTIVTALAVVGLAFSINMIEFACSIGIPQAFTKIVQINNLSLISQQFYIFIYTLFYMVDDFVVFGLALYGFDKFYTVGQKYSNLSSLIGGVLMLILGGLMIFAPSLLVF